MADSWFAAEPANRFEHEELTARAHQVMVSGRVALDAGVRQITRVGGPGSFTFEVLRHDGTSFEVRVAVEFDTGGKPASVVDNSGTGARHQIRISPRVDPRVVDRVVVNAVVQLVESLKGTQSDTDVLDPNTTPGPDAELSVQDRGRLAQLRDLHRATGNTSRLRVLRRRRMAAEMRGLIEHLGLHPADPGSAARRALTDVGAIVDEHAGDERPAGRTPPAVTTNTPPVATPGARTRENSVRALEESRFSADPNGRERGEIQTRARSAMLNPKIAQDAGVAGISQKLGEPFVVTRAGGSSFKATVVSGRTSDRSPAEVDIARNKPNEVVIRISSQLDPALVKRTVASAVALASALLQNNPQTTNLLDGTTHPGSGTKLSPEDQARQAHARYLDRAKQKTSPLRVIRRHRIAAEMKTLVEHLGLHPADELAAQRGAVSDIEGIVQKHVTEKSKRLAWTQPPDGYPQWSAFLRYHLPAETAPGLAAAIAIGGLGNWVGAAGLATYTIVTGVTGTLTKRWAGRQAKTLVDTGHGDRIKKRNHEQAEERRKLLKPLFDQAQSLEINTDGPGEPAPELDNPEDKAFLPWWKRVATRGFPQALGAGAASSLMSAGLPGWAALSYAGVAGVTVLFGPLADRFFQARNADQEWGRIDNVGRQQDDTSAEFNRLFVERFAAVVDRVRHLHRVAPTGTNPNPDPAPNNEIAPTGYLHHGADQAAGNSQNAARAGISAEEQFQTSDKEAGKAADLARTDPTAAGEHAKKAVTADNAAWDLLATGGLRVGVGIVANAFINRNFLDNEYKEIIAQVHQDYGKKMAEQTATEQRILTEMLAELTAAVDAAETELGIHQERDSQMLRSRAQDLQAATPPTPLVPDDADRPAGYQRWQAVAWLHTKLSSVTMAPVLVAAWAFNQGFDPAIIIGSASAVGVASFWSRFQYRRREQWAVDETVVADRLKERVIEAAEGKAYREFMVEFWTREVKAAVSGRTTPVARPAKPKKPADPALPRRMRAHIKYERALMFHEPMPVSTLGARRLALDRLERMVRRVQFFETQARTTGNDKPLTTARTELGELWEAYQKLKEDGTPMPPDYEILKPEGMRSGEPGTRLTGPLRQFLDDSKETRAGRAFYPPGKMQATAYMVPAEPGTYTIDLHGGPDFVSIGDTRLTVEDLAALIEADENWHGEPIRLLSCETGKNPGGFAQQLADRLGVTVHAPSDYVGVTLGGTVYVTSLGIDESGRVVPVLPPTGRMIAFTPRTTLITRPNLGWPDRTEVEFREMHEIEPVEELGELTLMRDGPTVYTGGERLWPDELAEIIVENKDWAGGPTRLQVRDGHVDPEFGQRLADLLGVPVVVPAKSVAGEFPTLSSGTLEVYDEPRPVPPPPGCRVYEPRTVAAGKGTP